MTDGDLFEWTNLFPQNTGLPVTIWVSVCGTDATNPSNSDKIEHADAVFAWIKLNHEVLIAHWRGDIGPVLRS
jgi:hypothetical protein